MRPGWLTEYKSRTGTTQLWGTPRDDAFSTSPLRHQWHEANSSLLLRCRTIASPSRTSPCQDVTAIRYLRSDVIVSLSIEPWLYKAATPDRLHRVWRIHGRAARQTSDKESSRPRLPKP